MSFDVEAASDGSTLDPVGDLAGYAVVNHTTLSDSLVLESSDLRQVAEDLQRWSLEARKAASSQGMFARDAFIPPSNPYDEIRAARRALSEDDIVGAVADVTESFAFDVVKWEGRDPDLSDVFNQWSRDIDLDHYLRELWRELFGASQAITATEWDWQEFKVRGKTEKGNERKKRMRLWVPVKMRVIDTTKVVPVGFSPMGSDFLAWCSAPEEVTYWGKARRGEIDDPLMARLFRGRYIPSEDEKGEIADLGINPDYLMLMEPELVWRHTLTKPSYERFADVRLKSLFKLLDLKQQLLNADRAYLIGAANYILLIRKGSDQLPAQQQEVDNLRENFNFIAKLPVIISDHRLEVDIIAPKTDHSLKQDRYDLIDTRILMRLLGTLALGQRGQRNETNVTLSRAVARSIENRRHMIRRSIEANIARAIFEHPNNQRELEGHEEPNLVFVPRNVALDIDAAFVQAILQLRSRWEISRETVLEYFGFDQAVEAQRRELEETVYDDIFETVTPFDSPENGPGRPTGGGDSPENATTATDRTANGNKSTGGS